MACSAGVTCLVKFLDAFGHAGRNRPKMLVCFRPCLWRSIYGVMRACHNCGEGVRAREAFPTLVTDDFCNGLHQLFGFPEDLWTVRADLSGAESGFVMNDGLPVMIWHTVRSSQFHFLKVLALTSWRSFILQIDLDLSLWTGRSAILNSIVVAISACGVGGGPRRDARGFGRFRLRGLGGDRLDDLLGDSRGPDGSPSTTHFLLDDSPPVCDLWPKNNRRLSSYAHVVTRPVPMKSSRDPLTHAANVHV
jgi:hypothetical protein